MELKYGVLLLALACGVWALSVSSLIFLDDVAEFQYPSELPRNASPIAIPENFSAAESIANTLNFYLPVAICCIAFLAYTRSTSELGFGFLGLALAVVALATHTTLKAGVSLHESGIAQLPELVWWI
ncbi:MAG: hypothetical protein AAGD22_16010 [Verrucomicrobiota bacterium]